MRDSSVVLVQLTSGGPSYSYFSHEELVETDLVVVELPVDQRRLRFLPYAGGTVVDTNPVQIAKDRATKWIVCKVDTTKYDALKQMFHGRKNGKL